MADQFFIKPIKNNVDFGYYWNDKPKPDMAICYKKSFEYQVALSNTVVQLRSRSGPNKPDLALV